MILLILFFALGFRLIGLDQSLWLDEAINVVAAKEQNFFYFVWKYPIGDFHPPLYFALLWVWGHLFGWSEVSVRFPSVLLGVGTTYFVYLIGRQLVSWRCGAVAALMLALAPLHLYYSQEARMYSLAAFMVAASFYFYLRIIKGEKGDRGNWLGYFVSSAGVLYSDYLAYLALPVQFISTILFFRPYFKTVIFVMVLSGLSLLPWIPVFLEQLRVGREAALALEGWKTVVGGAGVKEIILLPVKILIGRISFDDKFIYGGIVALISLPYLYLLGGLRILGTLGQEGKIFLTWLLLPPALAWVISLFIPVFNYFRFIFILPAFYLLAAEAGLRRRDGSGRLGGLGILGMILIGELVFSGIYLFDSRFWREDWRGAVLYAEQNSTPVILENNAAFSPYLYYGGRESASPGLRRIPVKDMDDIVPIPDSLKSVYIFEYLVDVTDPERLLEKNMISLGFVKTSVADFRGVGFVKKYQR